MDLSVTTFVNYFRSTIMKTSGSNKIYDAVYDSFSSEKDFLHKFRQINPCVEEVILACDSAHDLLRQVASTKQSQYDRVFGSFWLSSSFLQRCVEKPAGYAGDWKTILLIYEDAPSGMTPVERGVDRWALSQPCPQAVRNRRKMIAEKLAHLTKGRVLSLGCGPAVEILDSLQRGCGFHTDLIDIDESALSYVKSKAQDMKKERQISTKRANIKKLFLSNTESSREKYDFIYSAGLIDYFDDESCLLLLNWCFSRLCDGGEMMLGNFKPNHPNEAFFNNVLKWPLILRSKQDLLDLAARSEARHGTCRVEAEEEGIQLFLRCTK